MQKLNMALLTATLCLAHPASSAEFMDMFAAQYGSNAATESLAYAPDVPIQKPKIFKRADPSVHYCVRTCDGRYFPAPFNGSRADGCKAFCPAAEMKVFSGESIEDAAAADGKLYRSSPNAFRYRNELVANCTCNGKTVGLASIAIKDDKTLKGGDQIANERGVLVNARAFASSKVQVVGIK